jgi:DNA invertase Pin-like site-specific DNA recombinase
MSEKIQGTHLQRRVIVYPRQSTMRQLHEHRESTARQYALRQRATQLGWSENQVDVIDEDLGHSGASAEWRPGFQRLAEAVARGRVGAIFALEVSRFARSSADWHRLLELCGLADVLIADEQAVYNPRDYNDRLLLGLKGTMSEAEQYWMRLRLEGGRLSKARRGELFFCPPAGYEWDATALRFRFDAKPVGVCAAASRGARRRRCRSPRKRRVERSRGTGGAIGRQAQCTRGCRCRSGLRGVQLVGRERTAGGPEKQQSSFELSAW